MPVVYRCARCGAVLWVVEGVRRERRYVRNRRTGRVKRVVEVVVSARRAGGVDMRYFGPPTPSEVAVIIRRCPVCGAPLVVRGRPAGLRIALRGASG